MEIKEFIGEEWRPVRGYEGLYEVSSFGRVRSLDKLAKGSNNSMRLVKGKILKINNSNTHRYSRVKLAKNDSLKDKYIHILVAEAFIPNPNNYPCVNHKNEIKTDNRVENLEWCTVKYNCLYYLERHSYHKKRPIFHHKKETYVSSHRSHQMTVKLR